MAKGLWDGKANIKYIKLGIFFLGAFIVFFTTLLSIREVNIFKGTYNLIIRFEFAEGLRPSAPVRYCGVDVGEVKGVTVVEENKKPLVHVRAKIQDGIRIPKDSYFFINSLSLFGEKYLEIAPPETVGAYAAENEIIEGIAPVPLFTLFSTFNKTMKEVEAFVKEGKIKTTFESILLNLDDISLEVKGLFEDMKDKQGTIGRLLYDDSLYRTTEELLQDLKEHPWKLLHKPKDKKRR